MKLSVVPTSLLERVPSGRFLLTRLGIHSEPFMTVQRKLAVMVRPLQPSNVALLMLKRVMQGEHTL